MDISYSLFFVTLMVILYVPDLCGASSYGEDWVDPDPLSKLNRDRTSEPLAKKERNPFQETEVCMKIEKTSVIKRKLNRCSQLLTNCSKQLHDLKLNLSSLVHPKERSPDDSVQKQGCEQDKLFMKRFINIFLKVSRLNEEMPQTLDTHLYITVTPDQLKVLQQFSKGSQDVTLQELDHVMSSVLLSSKSDMFFEEYIPWSAVASFFQPREMGVALVGCLSVLLIWKVLNGHSVIRVMTMFVATIIIISYSMMYCRMYKQAEIKQYAVMKAKGDVPAECRPPSEQTWMERVFSGDRSDECRKYFEAGMLDPFLEVTPTLVLSELVAGFFLHPSGMLGDAVAKYSKNLLGGLPFGVNYLVLYGSFFLIPIIITAIIFACCGGVIRLPWYIGGLELSGQTPQQRTTALELSGQRPQERITAPELSGQRPQERITAEPQKTQVTELVKQSSGSSVLNEAAISNFMHTADSADAELVITNVTSIRRLVSAGNTTVVHRDIIEEIQQSSPEKKCIHYPSEQSGQFRSADVTHVSDCCESQSRSHCAVLEGETITVESGCLHQPLRKNQTEDLQLRMRAATCVLRDKHIEIQSTEVVKKCTEALQQKDGTEESASADKDALSDCRVASTVHSCKVGESDVEEERNSRRNSSIDVSDEEIGFVKL